MRQGRLFFVDRLDFVEGRRLPADHSQGARAQRVGVRPTVIAAPPRRTRRRRPDDDHATRAPRPRRARAGRLRNGRKRSWTEAAKAGRSRRSYRGSVLGVLLLGVLAYEVPSLMKSKKPPAASVAAPVTSPGSPMPGRPRPSPPSPCLSRRLSDPRPRPKCSPLPGPAGERRRARIRRPSPPLGLSRFATTRPRRRISVNGRATVELSKTFPSSQPVTTTAAALAALPGAPTLDGRKITLPRAAPPSSRFPNGERGVALKARTKTARTHGLRPPFRFALTQRSRSGPVRGFAGGSSLGDR